MDCKLAEKIIVESFLEEADAEEKKLLFIHLDRCSKCKNSYFKLKEVLTNSSIKDNETFPRLEIIDRLQQIARINSQKDEPLVKRYFRMPILVPLFGAAMALMIFLNIDINPDLPPVLGNKSNSTNMTESANAVNTSADDSSISRNREKETESDNYSSDIDKSLISKVGFTPGFRRGVSISDIDDEFFMNQNSLTYNAAQPESSSDADTTAAEQGNEVIREERNATSIASNAELKEDIAGQNITLNSIIEKGEGFEVASAVSNPSELLSLNSETNALIRSENKKIQGNNCDNGINENIGAIGTNQDFEKQKEMYMNIAECYENQGYWEKALENYNRLKEIDSDYSSDYQEKINFIEETHLQN